MTPMNVGFYIHRVGEFTMLMLGESVFSLVIVDVPNDRRMSFGELDERVRRLANGLLSRCGLSKGDRVAVLSKNCIPYFEIYLACARAGFIAQVSALVSSM